jgi:hypothetical protein
MQAQQQFRPQPPPQQRPAVTQQPTSYDYGSDDPDREDDSSACLCCVTVGSGDIGIVEHCGIFSRVANPGLSYVFWPFEQVVSTTSMRVRQLDATVETKTKDHVTIHVGVSVMYQIINAEVDLTEDEGDSVASALNAAAGKSRGSGPANIYPENRVSPRDPKTHHGAFHAFYKLSNAEHQIETYIQDCVRAELPRHTLDEAYALKSELADSVKEALDHQLHPFGFEIKQVRTGCYVLVACSSCACRVCVPGRRAAVAAGPSSHDYVCLLFCSATESTMVMVLTPPSTPLPHSRRCSQSWRSRPACSRP